LTPDQVQTIKLRLRMDSGVARGRDLAMFCLAIDSKLRASDLVGLRVADIAEQTGSGEVSMRTRSKVVQRKTGTEVAFEISPDTQAALRGWIKGSKKLDWDRLFTSTRGSVGCRPLSTRQYERLVKDWVQLAGLKPAKYGTHSLRRTKVALLYKQTGNLRAAQLLLGHASIENTARYLGIEQDDALTMSERVRL
jgi:integrase